jgi:kynurenine formamidase
MFDPEKYRIVDLSPRLIARIKRMDGTIEEGNRDATGLGWVLEEGIADYDKTMYTWIGGWPDDDVWKWRISGHFGSHTEGGKGHLDHWEGLPDNVQGLWEYPLEQFFGPAAVCDMSSLEPGAAILPEHLDYVQEGDIVLMYSTHREANQQPYLPGETAAWLALERKIKMFAVEMPGIAWETNYQSPSPDNSPTHRSFLGNNIPITYPLVNLSTLKKDRVTYFGFPLSVERLDGSFIRAIAFEEK